MNGDANAKIEHNVDKTMKVNGRTVADAPITVYLNSASGKDIPQGTQIIDGKYLSEKDWKFKIGSQVHGVYLRSNKLYVGSE